MRAHGALSIGAGNVDGNHRPEGLRLAEVSPERMPLQARILGSQGGQARSGNAAPLILRDRVRLLDPSKSALTASLVIDDEHLATVEICRSLTPADALSRHRVLPRST